MPNKKRKINGIALAMTLPGLVSAQTLEEVVVTAQKRAQSLQDVPVAVSAMSGDWMRNNNVADLEDIAALIPNLSLSGTPGVNTVRIRGLGTGGGNAAFEQSVGMYVDGIYAGRGYQFSLPYLDVERVEVLKGPQGVLFGKNSIAGAISISSKRPSPEFEGELSLSYEAENDGYQGEAIINGELMPQLSGRLAASYVKEGGWVSNTLLRERDQPEVDMSGLRASLLWDATDDLEVFFKYDRGTFEQSGSEMGIRHIAPGSTNPFIDGNPTWLSLYQAEDPQVGLIKDHLQSSGRSLIDTPDGDFNEVDSEAITLQLDWDLGEHVLTSLSGFSTYEVDTFSDSSFAPLTIVNQRGEEDFSQFTQELRLTSPLGERFEYIIGLFYLDRSLELPGRQVDLALGPVFGPTLPAPAPPLPTELIDSSLAKSYDEDTTSASLFGQLTWNFTETVRASLGLRYSYEKKEVDAENRINSLGTNEAINPVGAAVLEAAFGTVPYTFADTRTEENLDPSLTLQWDATDSVMLYAAATMATKAGGYNAGDQTGEPEVIEYEEEEATGFEIGVKSELLDRRLRLNAAVFHTTFEDLQVSVLDAATNTFFIGNAAEATSQGLELDATYLLGEALTLGASVAYLDAYFNDFPGAPCATSIYQQADCQGDGPSASRNAKGEPMIHSPDWSGNLYIDYQTDLNEALTLGLRLDANFVDDFVYSLTYADPFYQDAFVKWDARLSLAHIDQRWELSLVGKNLSDETTESFGDNTFSSPGVYFGNVDAPRQVYLNATWRF
ncbi:MAG: TonB-dependent receptor [Pseudomonadota bacterium]